MVWTEQETQGQKRRQNKLQVNLYFLSSYFRVKFSVPRRLRAIECRGHHTDYLFRFQSYLFDGTRISRIYSDQWVGNAMQLRPVSLSIFLLPLLSLFVVDEVFCAKKTECSGVQGTPLFLSSKAGFPCKDEESFNGKTKLIQKLEY